MKKNIIYSIGIAAMMVFFFSCEKDDYTGHSTLKPTNPTATITVPGAIVTLQEQAISYTYTITLSEPQVVDVAFYVFKVEGTATEGTADNGGDFVIKTPLVVIPASFTTGSAIIEFSTDNIFEDTETLKIQIGDSRTGNCTFTPATVEYSITNATSNILTAHLTWETDVAEVVGLNLDPDEAVNLRMLIIDEGADTICATINSASFETFDEFNNLANGTYLIATDIASVINAGDFNAIITISMELAFSQDGVFTSTLEFPNVVTTVTPCATYRTYLAKVTKTGNTYSLTKDISYSWSTPLPGLSATWYGTEFEGAYPSEVVTQMNGADLTILGLGYGWISDFWGEEIVTEVAATIEFDWTEHGKINIPQQPYFTTLYEGTEYPYEIVGSGVVNTCGNYTTMTIEYDLIQDGFSTATWTYNKHYMSTPLFVAILTLDPNGKIIKKEMINKPDLTQKP